MASIMIVEDETMLAEAWREALLPDGHEVTAVGTGSEAVQIMKSKQFDVVITDLMMPDGGGMYVSGMTRMLQGHRRIIVVSGHLTIGVTGATRKDALSGLGVRRFLSKPVDINDLRRAIKEALEDENDGVHYSA